MGITRTRLTLSNPSDPTVRRMEVEALVDTGATYLCIPAGIAAELRVATESLRDTKLANGRVEKCAYVGPIRVEFENRLCIVGGLVMGDEVLLGAMPLQDLDLVITPLTHKVAVNPSSPNVGMALAK